MYFLQSGKEQTQNEFLPYVSFSTIFYFACLLLEKIDEEIRAKCLHDAF